MRLQSIVREAWRDVATGTTRVWVLCTVFLLLIGALIAQETLTVSQLIQQARAFQTAGANVRVVIAENRIDGAACHALNERAGVTSVALDRAETPARPFALPSVPLEVFRATPAAAQVLRATPTGDSAAAGAGALLGQAAQEELGRTASLATSAGTYDITGVYPYPDDGRRGGFGYAVVLPETPRSTPYDECWITAWPEVPDTQALLASTVRSTGGEGTSPPNFTQLNTSLGQEFTGHARYTERLGRFAPYLALVIGAVIGFAGVRGRKLELASARHVGVTLGAQMTTQVVQHAVWLALTSGALLLAQLLVAQRVPEGFETLLEIAGRIVGFAAGGVIAGVTVACMTIRERDLFLFFKNRN